MAVITAIENKQISEDSLGDTELNNLYNILGLVACCNQLESEKRLMTLNWCLTRLQSQLCECPKDNKDKMSRIVYQILTVTKGFH